MTTIFLKYLQATGNKKSMNRFLQQESGLTEEEFIFCHDHFDELKAEYATLLALAIGIEGTLNKCDISNPLLQKAKSIVWKTRKFAQNASFISVSERMG